MISFNCPSCRQNLKVKDELAGKKGKCPRCAQPLLVPPASSPRGDQSLDESVFDAQTLPPESGPVVAPPPRRSPTARQSSLRGTDSTSRISRSVWPGTLEPGSVPATVNPEHCDFLAPPEQPDELGR